MPTCQSNMICSPIVLADFLNGHWKHNVRISSVKATPVNIPLEAGYRWSVGVLEGMPKTIIEVQTSDGIVGLGESPSDAQADVINKVLGPALIGKDPFDLVTCEMSCVPEWRSALNIGDANAARAFGGIELALWDIKGKALNQPLYKLLGGAIRKEIQFSEYFAYRLRENGKGGEACIADVVEYCLKMRQEHGSTIFEGKVGFSNVQEELKLVQTLREALGDEAVIRLDANYGWTMATANQMVKALEPLNIRNIEDPVFGFENMARLRQHTSIPFSTHECNLQHAVACGAPDAFVANIAALGGLAHTLRFANACEVMCRDFWCYSGDSGIMTAAYLHLSAATASIREPHQSLGRWQPMDVIEEGTLRSKNNVIAVPEGPGLGVTLSQEKLRVCHQHYLTHGPCKEFLNPKGSEFLRLPRF